MPRSPSIYATRAQQKNQQKTLPAPVGGLNARDSLAAMPPTQAVILNNWFPVQYGLRVRHGWRRWYNGIPGVVQSLIKHNGVSGTEQMFAAAGGNFIDVTFGGQYNVADIVATGFTNDKWQWTQLGNAFGTHTVAVNGADTPQKYTAGVWTNCVLTSLDLAFDPKKLVHVVVMHRRLWFTERDSTNIWYLPVDQIEGACELFPVGAVFPQGGYLQVAIPWSVDTGVGMDDMSVFISSKGDIAVYQGIDPDTGTDFTLVGTYTIGGTVGRRCATKFGSDVAILSETGVVLLTSILSQSKMLMQPPLTDMIQHILSDDVNLYATKFGWELFPVQRFNQLYINVPAASTNRQYVQNTITNAWTQFSGYEAECWVKMQEEAFFGSTGYVAHAWEGFVDDPDAEGIGTSIAATCLQAFNYFDTPAQKLWNMVRPVFTAAAEPSLAVNFNVDFEVDSDTPAAPIFVGPPVGAQWDVAKWDEGIWTGGASSWRRWFSLNNIGFAGAIFLRTATVNDTNWVSTDFVFLSGNIL